MKLIRIFLALCLLVAAAGLPSQAAEENKNLIEFSAEFLVWSRYLGAQGTIWSRKATSTTDITISLSKTPLRGLYANLYMYTALDKTAFFGQNSSNEIDVTLGFAREIKGIQVDFGISYFDVIPLFSIETNVWAPFAEAGKEFKLGKGHAITPFIRIEARIPHQDHGPKSGIFALWGVKHSWKITEALALKQKLNLLYDSGAFGLQESLHAQYRGEIQYAISKHFYIKPAAISFSAPLNKVSDGRRPEAVFSGGIGINF